MLFSRSYFLLAMGMIVGTSGSLGRAQVAADEAGKLVAALPERSLPGLDALLRQGLEVGPTILIQRLAVEQSEANARISRAQMLPNAYASVSGGQILEQLKTNPPTEDRLVDAVLYNFGVSQPLFHWGALSNSYKVSKLYAAISARNMEETRRLLAVDLRRRYFDLTIATGALELAQKELVELERQLAFAKKQVADGFAPSSESSMVDAKIIVARLAITRLENDLATLRRNLARMVGLAVEKLPPAAKELPTLPAIGESLTALSGKAPAVASARLQTAEDYVRIEALNYKVTRTRLRPKLGMAFSVGQDNRAEDNTVLGTKRLITTWSGFATVNWQLFDGFATNAAKASSLSRLRAYELERDSLVQQETDERRTEVAALQLTWRRLQESEKSFSGAAAGVATAEKDFAAGWVPKSIVEDAQRAADVSLQTINIARAEFHTALATYLSNRGEDPALSARP